jgi:hypothetical protein
MIIFHHRVNESFQLRNIPFTDGVEIDLRSKDSRIILQHDPYKNGEDFEKWLEVWFGQFLILNIKEEGLEELIFKILLEREISNYFLLDQSFPFLHRTLRSGNKKVAVRVSDIESIETALSVDSEWVWVDCFNGNWEFLLDMIPKLVNAKKKICLVSPELVRENSAKELSELKNLLGSLNYKVDGICTKNRMLWE